MKHSDMKAIMSSGRARIRHIENISHLIGADSINMSPKLIFKFKNLMTQTILGFIEIPGYRIYIELSTDKFVADRLVGFTPKRFNKYKLVWETDRDLRCVFSERYQNTISDSLKAEILEYLETHYGKAYKSSFIHQLDLFINRYNRIQKN